MFRYGEASSKILKKQKNKIQFIKKRWYGFLPLIFYTLLLSSLILSLFNKLFLITFSIGILLYLLAIMYTTARVWASFKKIDALRSMGIIPLQHLSYTLGVLRGL